MLSYNEVTPKRFVVVDGQPYEVLSANVFRKQQRKPVNQTTLRALMGGNVIEHTFHQSDKVEEADIEKKEAEFVYTHRGEWWFKDPNDPSDRFTVNQSILDDAINYLKEGQVVTLLVFDNSIVDVTLPIKVTLEVAEAPPNVKGNTTQGGTKRVTLETGHELPVPLFIERGDVIEVNTETGEYTGRIS